jgi:hypothetical protein
VKAEGVGGKMSGRVLTKKWYRPYPRAAVLAYSYRVRFGGSSRCVARRHGAGGPHILGVSPLPCMKISFAAVAHPKSFHRRITVAISS